MKIVQQCYNASVGYKEEVKVGKVLPDFDTISVPM